MKDRHVMSTSMDERPAVEVLRSALRATVTYSPDHSGIVRRGVRDAVCAVVDELRTEGMAPEDVVVFVRSIATSAGADYFSDINSDAIRWCIARYFGAPLHD